MSTHEIRKRIADVGLRVTLQRVAVLEALTSKGNHPTAEGIIAYLEQH